MLIFILQFGITFYKVSGFEVKLSGFKAYQVMIVRVILLKEKV